MDKDTGMDMDMDKDTGKDMDMDMDMEMDMDANTDMGIKWKWTRAPKFSGSLDLALSPPKIMADVNLSALNIPQS